MAISMTSVTPTLGKLNRSRSAVICAILNSMTEAARPDHPGLCGAGCAGALYLLSSGLFPRLIIVNDRTGLSPVNYLLVFCFPYLLRVLTVDAV